MTFTNCINFYSYSKFMNAKSKMGKIKTCDFRLKKSTLEWIICAKTWLNWKKLVILRIELTKKRQKCHIKSAGSRKNLKRTRQNPRICRKIAIYGFLVFGKKCHKSIRKLTNAQQRSKTFEPFLFSQSSLAAFSSDLIWNVKIYDFIRKCWGSSLRWIIQYR